jgi:hypothetical protein
MRQKQIRFLHLHSCMPEMSLSTCWTTDQSPGHVVNSADDPITHLHYFWCSTTSLFEFRHFLALTSAVRKYRPQLVHFHTALLPQSAPHFFEWYEDVKRTIPLLELHQTNRCSLCT